MFNLKNLGDRALAGQIQSVTADLKKAQEVDKPTKEQKAECAKLAAYLKDLKAECAARKKDAPKPAAPAGTKAGDKDADTKE